MSTIDEIRDLKREYLARIQKDGRAEILRLAAEALEKDNVEKISWVQYTPHFNDGDPCTFNVHDIQAYDADDKELDYYGEWNTELRKRGPSPRPNIQAFDAAIHELEDMMEIVFGDGVRVTIERDGTIEVEDYDHD